MTENDLCYVVLWWLTIFLFGLAFLPLATRVFARFFDRGYLFSKTIGIALVSYGAWLFSSLHLIPFARWSILLFLILGGMAAFLGGHVFHRSEKKQALPWRLFIFEEILFFLALLFWSFIRGLQPEIQGLEKFMDFGFVNSILRARFMPAPDMWLAGKAINYYYFGHFVTALLTRLSGIPSSVTYNLMISTLFAFTFTLSFSIGANLLHLLNSQKVRNLLLGGFLSAALVAFGGNLHTVIYAQILPLAHDMGLHKRAIKSYWYPDATRYIGYNPPTQDKTIHEFPLYSFVVADIHGHVLDIPFVMTFLAILLVLLTRKDQPGEDWRKRVAEGLLLGFGLTIFYITNAWDFPVYLMVAGMVLLYLNYLRYRFSLELLGVMAIQVAVIFVIFFVLSWPFRANFVHFAKGAGVPKFHSPIYQLLVLWGYQLFFMALFLFFLLRKKKAARTAPLDRPDIFVLILGLASLVLLFLPEVIFVRDIYGEAYARANTMFKLVYQAFILLALSAGYICFRLLLVKKNPFLQYPLILFFACVLAMPLVYPFYAIPGYYGSIFQDQPVIAMSGKPNIISMWLNSCCQRVVQFWEVLTHSNSRPKQLTRYQHLDGLGFLSRQYPDDVEAINWLNRNVSGQPVILEANGDSYTDYGRVSMVTGLPTVLGWFVHEWLWRGANDICTKRVGEISIIFESLDPWGTRFLLNKYKIEYIFLGKLERDKFKNLKEKKLLTLGEVVFHCGNTKIIRVKPNSPTAPAK